MDKKLKIIKIIEIISACLGGLIALLFGAVIIQKMAFEEKPFSFLGLYVYEVQDSSMEKEGDKDSLSDGDLFFAFKSNKLSVGSLVLFLDDEEYKVRKVIKVDGDTLGVVRLSRSFNIEGEPDEYIKSDQCLAKKVFSWHGYTSFRSTVVSPVVIIIIGVIFFGGFIACYILERAFSTKFDEETKKVKKEDKEEKEEKEDK